MSRKEQYEMLKRFRIVGLCLAAVFALSAVAASSASAYPVWQECGAGTEFTNANCTTAGSGPYGWVTLTTKVASTSSGALTLTAGGITMECEGTDGGTIGPGSQDEITKITASNCKSGSFLCKTAAAKALNLPWKTKLYNADATKIRDEITGPDATKEPGWEGLCEGFLKQECFTNTTAGIKNKSNGTVDATFDALSAKGVCKPSGEGTVTGTDTITVPGKTIRVK